MKKQSFKFSQTICRLTAKNKMKTITRDHENSEDEPTQKPGIRLFEIRVIPIGVS